MSDRRRREERHRSRSRSRNRHRSRERHGSHHRSGRERHSRDRRSRSRSRDGGERRFSGNRYSPPHHSGTGFGMQFPPSSSQAGLYPRPPILPTPTVSYPAYYGAGLSQAGLHGPPLPFPAMVPYPRGYAAGSSQAGLRGPPLPFPAMVPYPGGYAAGSSQAGLRGPPLPFPAMFPYPGGYGAGSSQAGLHPRPSILPTQTVSYPADYGSGPSRRARDSEDFPDFGLRGAPGYRIVPAKKIVRNVKNALAGKFETQKQQPFTRGKDKRITPYMTEDRFTNYVKLNVPGIGTLLFYFFKCYIIKDESFYFERWHLYVKVRQTGPDTGPGSPNNGYAFVATLEMSYNLGQDGRLKFYKVTYYFPFRVQDIMPHLNTEELILWYQARHNFLSAKEVVDFLPTLWGQPLYNPDHRWRTRQLSGINNFYARKGVPAAKITEMHEQRRALQLTIEMPQHKPLQEQSSDEEDEQAAAGASLEDMDLLQDDIFGQN